MGELGATSLLGRVEGSKYSSWAPSSHAQAAAAAPADEIPPDDAPPVSCDIVPISNHIRLILMC
eukprot:4364522-Amphidinium_carterae.2